MKNILLIGCGRFGYNIAKELYSSNVSVLAVDRVEEKVNSILPFVTSSLSGDVKDKNFLSSLGVNNFDEVILTIDDDFESSAIALTLLKELGAPFVLCRASSDIQEKVLLSLGADKIIFPEREGAKNIALKCEISNLEEYTSLDSKDGIFELKTPSSWVGKSILDLDIRRKYGINVLAVKINDSVDININADTIFPQGSNVLILGSIERVKKVFKNEDN